jgi:hypothetical protein
LKRHLQHLGVVSSAQPVCGIFRSFGAKGRRLSSPGHAVDTLCMLDFVAQDLARSEDWRRVLEAYNLPRQPQKQPDPLDEQWLPRVPRLEGIDSTQLSHLHGTLIALGFLKFEISGKTGVQYQITPMGRQTLENGLVANAELD